VKKVRGVLEGTVAAGGGVKTNADWRGCWRARRENERAGLLEPDIDGTGKDGGCESGEP